MRGRSFLIRCGDDFVIGCEYEADARRILAVLPQRVARFGLTLHPQKTALVPFSKPPSGEESAEGRGTLEFLGFTHYWCEYCLLHIIYAAQPEHAALRQRRKMSLGDSSYREDQ